MGAPRGKATGRGGTAPQEKPQPAETTADTEREAPEAPGGPMPPKNPPTPLSRPIRFPGTSSVREARGALVVRDSSRYEERQKEFKAGLDRIEGAERRAAKDADTINLA